MVAYDSLGNKSFVKQAGGTGLDHAFSMGMDSNENLYLVGSTASQSLLFGHSSYEPSGTGFNMFIAKLSPYTLDLEESLPESALLEIVPNPNSGIFSIVSEEKLEQIEIYNLQGEKVFEKHFSKRTKQQEIETSLITGVYVLLIKTEAGNYTAQKMMVGK